MNTFSALFTAILITRVTTGDSKMSDDEFINKINNSQDLWKATKNGKTENFGIKTTKIPETLVPSNSRNFLLPSPKIHDNIVIPESFDAREKWPQCESISSVGNQGECGSCWAISTAAAASDRICISSNFKIKVTLSAQHILACCTFCGSGGKKGCDGGFAPEAWEFFQSEGIVTGGKFKSEKGCQPYEVPPDSLKDFSLMEKINYSFSRSFKKYFYRPKCYGTCTNKKYGRRFSEDKYYGTSAYKLPPKNEIEIQKDILRYGPSVASIDAYPELEYYSSGIYFKTVRGSRAEPHSVKLIGWGVEKGIKYWLAVNTWGENWGEKGTFRIRRGRNECNIEDDVSGGIPKIENYDP